jgi:flagellar hook-associated protein 1
MSSFGFGLGAGLRALTAARLGLQIAGNNVANANTPGYSRQRIELVAADPFAIARGFQIGSGVDVAGITRLVDSGLEGRLRLQMGLSGAAEVDQSRYAEIEGVLGEPDNGLSSSLAGFFGSIGSLQTDPADRSLRGGVVQAGTQLAQGLNLLSNRFSELANSTFNQVSGLVRQVNQHAQAIAALNTQITSIEANGSQANDLRDAREQHIKAISSLMDTRVLERNTGSTDLLVGGHLLVSGDHVSALSVTRDTSNHTAITASNNASITLQSGQIAALLQGESTDVPQLQDRMNRLAHNLILEVNRLQTTGVPAGGPFSTLTSFYGSADSNNNGTRGDELLSQGGFQFPVQNGDLYVTVSNKETGAMERTRIHVDPSAMTLNDFASALNNVNHVSASVDPMGRLRVNSDPGYGFDFSPRLDTNPDGFGSFGGANPTIGSTHSGPFDLSGQTFPVSFTMTTGTASSPTVTNVTLNASSFANTGAVTTDELVSAINSSLGSTDTAANIGGNLVIRSSQGGASSQLQLANVGAGTVLGALGLSTAATTGQDVGVTVQVEGSYSGSNNGNLVFRPSTDGQIGVTPNMNVDVFDENGRHVTTVNVGAGYNPGDPIDLGNGVSVRFGPGQVSATAGNVFSLDVLSNSDTSDVLVALGMNSFFHGTDASDISVNPDISTNPDLFAAGTGPAVGDASNLARMMGLRSTQLSGLDANTVEGFYTNFVGDVGFKSAAATSTLQSQDQLLSQLQSERDSVSGINLDEEMVDVTRYQQSYDAAARFISVVQQVTNTLINIGSTA